MIDLDDVSPADRDKVASLLDRVRFEEITDPEGPAFAAAYALLAEGFLAQGELEPREELADHVRQGRLEYGPGLDGSYHLIAVWDSDELIGVRDCYVDVDHAQGVCVVALAHVYVVPAWRRTGVAAALRALPATLARRALTARLGRQLPTLLVAEMEPVDPDDPGTVVRLLAYGRAGFRVLDPQRVRYSQADFSPEPPTTHTALPLLGVVRPIGLGDGDTVPEAVAAAFPRLFYVCHRWFVPAERIDPSEEHVWAHLPRDGEPVRLLPLPTGPDTLDRLAPLVRGAVLPLYPPGLRGPNPTYAEPADELARVRAAWASPIDLRPAVPADAAALATLAARTFAETFGADNRPEDLAAHLDHAYGEAKQRRELAAPDLRTLVATQDGALIGFAQLRVGAAPAVVTTPAPVEIWRFYIDRPWHGRGVAARLMRATLAEARALGAGSLWLGVWEHNPRATAFYRKFGFVAVGTHTFVLGQDAQTDVIMVSELAEVP